jgi:hypothetical protein
LKAASVSTRPDGSASTTFDLGDLEYFVDHDFPYAAIAVISGRSQRAIQAGVEKSGLCSTPGEFDALADDELERVQCLGSDARARCRAVQNSTLVSPSILAVGILISYGITSARLMVV